MMAVSLETWVNGFYNDLRSCANRERCMKEFGLSERDLFFPMTPKVVASKPKIILLAMEPSSYWANSNEDAPKQIESGTRCFWCDLGDFTLQFSIREALTEVFGSEYSKEYYITNMAKCALNVEKAKNSRYKRWQYCTSVMKTELEHIYREYDASDMPTVISIGVEPGRYIKKHPLQVGNLSAAIEIKVHDTIMHPSKNWLRKRLETYLSSNQSHAKGCNAESSVMKTRLVAFIQDVAGSHMFGTERARSEMTNDATLSLYARLSCVYKYRLVQSLQGQNGQDQHSKTFNKTIQPIAYSSG